MISARATLVIPLLACCSASAGCLYAGGYNEAPEVTSMRLKSQVADCPSGGSLPKEELFARKNITLCLDADDEETITFDWRVTLVDIDGVGWGYSDPAKPVQSLSSFNGTPPSWATATANTTFELSHLGKYTVQVTATDNGLDIDVRGSSPLPSDTVTELSRLAGQHGLARLTRHGELVLMRRPPQIGIGAARVTLPPGSFLQATVAGEDTLAARVQELCGKAKRIADLFCGVGPFALRLAARARIAAFDSDAGAIAALRKAAAGAHGLKPLAAEARDLFRRPLVPQELNAFDAVVFDPPRQGAEAQVRQLAASRLPLVVAVSCNPTTFARDARMLIDAGYAIDQVTPVDQFRHSAHVELVARFKRKR